MVEKVEVQKRIGRNTSRIVNIIKNITIKLLKQLTVFMHYFKLDVFYIYITIFKYYLVKHIYK